MGRVIDFASSKSSCVLTIPGFIFYAHPTLPFVSIIILPSAVDTAELPGAGLLLPDSLA